MVQYFLATCVAYRRHTAIDKSIGTVTSLKLKSYVTIKLIAMSNFYLLLHGNLFTISSMPVCIRKQNCVKQ